MLEFVAGHSAGKDLTFSLCHTVSIMPFPMPFCMGKRAQRKGGVPRGPSVHCGSFQLHSAGKV